MLVVVAVVVLTTVLEELVENLVVHQLSLLPKGMEEVVVELLRQIQPLLLDILPASMDLEVMVPHILVGVVNQGLGLLMVNLVDKVADQVIQLIQLTLPVEEEVLLVPVLKVRTLI
jgi:anti-sigma regulatory factor (Ser/Thr protein kinase)